MHGFPTIERFAAGLPSYKRVMAADSAECPVWLFGNFSQIVNPHDRNLRTFAANEPTPENVPQSPSNQLILNGLPSDTA